MSSVLSRTADQRAREHRYRFAQAMVFGLPVLALDLFGDRLGGAESQRWVCTFQALLAGWVVYVSASGMLFEWIILALGRRARWVSADAAAAAFALAIYVHGLVCTIMLLAGRAAPAAWLGVVVIVLMAWTGLRWALLAYRIRRCRTPARAGTVPA